PNPECAKATRPEIPRDPENAQSVGSIVAFGAFRLLDFGDLTADIEYDLMCPNNPIGTVDVYFASNHGTNNANSPVLIHPVAPRGGGAGAGGRAGAGGPGGPAGTPGQAPPAAGAAPQTPTATPGAVPPAGASQAGPAVPGGGRGGGLPPHSPAYWIKISVQPSG